MKFTIEDLRNGKCAVQNNGTLEELKQVLKLAFPKTVDNRLKGCDSYYFRFGERNTWTSSDKHNFHHLPVQSVKDFLEPEFKYTEEVQVSDNNICWESALFCCLHPSKNNKFPYIALITENDYTGVSAYKYCRKVLQKVKKTKAEIAEAFNISLDQLEIID